MPYIQQWIEPKKNPKLKVYPNLPPDYQEVRGGLTQGCRLANIGGKFFALPEHTLHFCETCGGWVEGACNEYAVNNLDGRHLSGRRGTDYHCARCGGNLGFIGMMS